MPASRLGPFAFAVLVGLPCPALAEKGPLLDAHADPLPFGAVMRLGSVRFLHRAWPHALAFLPDGKTLLSASQEAYFRQWDRQGREVRRFTGKGSSISSLALSRDGKRVAATDNGSQLLVWDVAGGDLQFVVDRAAYPSGLAWSPDGKSLAYHNRDAGLLLLDPETGKERLRFPGSLRAGRDIAFTPNGKRLVTIDSDNKHYGLPRVWDAATGKELHRLEEPPAYAKGMSLSPDGKVLAAYCNYPLPQKGSSRDTVRLWSVETGKRLRDLEIGSVNAVAFSPDGKVLATVDASGRVCLWSPDTGKKVRDWSAHQKHAASSLAFSPDGKCLASGGMDDRVCLFEVETGKELFPRHGHAGHVLALAFAPDGKSVVTGGADRTLRRWDWASGKERGRSSETGGAYGVTGLAISPDGKTIASLEPMTWPRGVRLWEADTLKETGKFALEDVYPLALTFARDGKRIVVASHENVRVHDLGGKVLRTPATVVANTDFRFGAPFDLSPDGKLLLWEDGKGLGVWEAEDPGAPRIRPEGALETAPATFSPDGVTLARGGPKSIDLYDVASGKRVGNIAAALFEEPDAWRDLHSLAYSPDGSLLACAMFRDVYLWDVQADRLVTKFAAASRARCPVVFGPDGRLLARGWEDGTSLVYDLTGRLVQGRLPVLKLTVAQRLERWRVLAEGEAPLAQKAMWELASDPAAVGFVEERLQRPDAAPARLARLIADLDAEDAKKRDKATLSLEETGIAARKAIEQALEGRPSLEALRRLKDLLREIDRRVPLDELRGRRAVAVLQRIGGDEAREVVRWLAGGGGGKELARHAGAALSRMGTRKPGR